MHGRYGSESRTVSSVIGTPIDSLSWETALSRLSEWALSRQSRYICICNVHSVVTARHDRSFARVISEADMATPDGAPVAWLMRKLGFANQQRINGPDFMWRYCAEAAQRDESIYLYGGQQRTLDLLQTRLLQAFPGLKIAGAYSPPFRALSAEEDEAIVEAINASGAGTVWVSLGCPKQEAWMAAHRGRIKATMIGVGAAFDYHAGTIQRAPLWMQRNGLEWLHRVCSEPRRLWRRYLVTNTLFIAHATQQLLASTTSPAQAAAVVAERNSSSPRTADLMRAIAEQATRLSLDAALQTSMGGPADQWLLNDLHTLAELTGVGHEKRMITKPEEHIREVTRLIGRITIRLDNASGNAKAPATSTQPNNLIQFPATAQRTLRELTRLAAELDGARGNTAP
ncbi:WecB/TagA/CpsF family glycosyltransferase [Stutzerimonas stutzeri]|uniref:WecB/TagA/CpsF family glycosyltransferase n=1 Tax=Stutzerimonas stutzeri TaxID=316 RepID=UPI0022DDBCB1|nr:WecB/TagA/CpsF family glycosyltransferase [Stutzerimonas stutzeri]WBL59225.1 WecB/TagA/CpsF family glycosyltransferase [Stutzerimonas stutzeri]